MPSLRTAIVVLSLCALALGASGCRKRTLQAAPPAVVSPSLPETKPETKPDATKPETPPEITPAAPPPATSHVPQSRPAPVKPRPASPEPAPPPPKPAPPQISPRLTPEEQAEAERHINEDISLAERNLRAASGKQQQLNAAQLDLIEKIRGFLVQAREAKRAGDWVRARNLAQKAQVLSNELVNSL